MEAVNIAGRVSIEVCPTSELIDAIESRAVGMMSEAQQPLYVVLDKDSYLRLCGELLYRSRETPGTLLPIVFHSSVGDLDIAVLTNLPPGTELIDVVEVAHRAVMR